MNSVPTNLPIPASAPAFAPAITPPRTVEAAPPAREQRGDSADRDRGEELRRLREMDRLVRQRELAQTFASGDLYEAGPRYRYETGSDGQRYAVDGAVRLADADASPEDEIRRARLVRQAALTELPPSPEGQREAARAMLDETRAVRALQDRMLRESARAAGGSGTLDVIA